jgi:hypothetical protein
MTMDGQWPTDISASQNAEIPSGFLDVRAPSLSPDLQLAGPSAVSTETHAQSPVTTADSTNRDGKNPAEVFELVLQCTGADMAPPIMEYLQRHAVWTNGRIRCVTAIQIHAMSSFAGDDPWPLLKWREGPENTDVMAIFKVDKSTGLCSCLMHYGVDRWWGSKGKSWKSSSMAWVVKSADHMRELFIAAQHVWGLLRESNVEILRLYANCNSENRSKNEYVLWLPKLTL